MLKFGIIGYGKMAEAIVCGLIKNKKFKEDEICIFDKDPSRISEAKKTNLIVSGSMNEAIKCPFILLAIKPQNLNDLAKFSLNKNQIIISILAGIKTEKLKEYFLNARIVRLMPNLPISIQKSTIAIFSESDTADLEDILTSLGILVHINEEMFDSFTAISGSAPAYIFEFMLAYQKQCELYGYKDAKEIVLQNMKGAVELYENSKQPLPDLIESVCSKGGTTIEAISYFRKNNLDKIISEGMDKCRLKSEELSKN